MLSGKLLRILISYDFLLQQYLDIFEGDLVFDT